jgi:ZIP family zinc transporter
VETSSVVQVFLLALLTAVATGIGALPFLFVKGLSRRWLGVSNALACGLMLAASFGLIYEGVAYSLWRALLGVVLGLGFIVLTRTLIQHEEHPVVLA